MQVLTIGSVGFASEATAFDPRVCINNNILMDDHEGLTRKPNSLRVAKLNWNLRVKINNNNIIYENRK